MSPPTPGVNTPAVGPFPKAPLFPTMELGKTTSDRADWHCI